MALRLGKILFPFLFFSSSDESSNTTQHLSEVQSTGKVAENQPQARVAESISSLWHRMRQATGPVYGDIGTSVLYCVMEITRETILIKNHHLGHDAASELVKSGGDGVERLDVRKRKSE
jgi:KUP system potassium uptake protein